MKKNLHPGDARLSALLRESRGSPPLPPRFQARVWQRIEDAAAPARSATWLDALAALMLRPRFALATAAGLLLAGVVLGAHDGSQIARNEAQARYVASVAPSSLR